MKYTARHLQKFLIGGKIDAALWTAHFPQVLVSCVPGCNDCKDFKTKACEGGKNPVDCFLSLKSGINQVSAAPADTGIPMENSRKYYPTSKGTRKSLPTGLHKGYDQSKM